MSITELNQRRGHPLLPQELRDKLPPLYSQEALGLQAQAIVKFFSPYSDWTWYASEGSPVDEDGYYDTDKPKVDYLLFGLVVGLETELGYFPLSELETAESNSIPLVERDLHWTPNTLGNLQRKHSMK